MTARAFAAEAVGTALLLVVIVGSGITAATDGAASAQLFQHAVVVGAALTALILALGHVSGAHLNPVVTIVDAGFGGLSGSTAAGYLTAQFGGATAGVVVANVLFDVPAIAAATTPRAGSAMLASEALATFGLLVVVFGVVRAGRQGAVAGAVGAYIAAAIYSTPSTSFANPAVTVARALSDTYTGIAPGRVGAFVLSQLVGALLAAIAIRVLFDPDAAAAAAVVVPHDPSDAEPRHMEEAR